MTMIRIVWHHSAGPLRPTAEDRAHYHRLIDGEGRVHAGDHPIEANAPGRPLVAGRYAAHTRGLNTGAIGVALCAMRGHPGLILSPARISPPAARWRC